MVEFLTLTSFVLMVAGFLWGMFLPSMMWLMGLGILLGFVAMFFEEKNSQRG